MNSNATATLKPRFCTKCGTPNRHEVKFCGICGQGFRTSPIDKKIELQENSVSAPENESPPHNAAGSVIQLETATASSTISSATSNPIPLKVSASANWSPNHIIGQKWTGLVMAACALSVCFATLFTNRRELFDFVRSISSANAEKTTEVSSPQVGATIPTSAEIAEPVKSDNVTIPIATSASTAAVEGSVAKQIESKPSHRAIEPKPTAQSQQQPANVITPPTGPTENLEKALDCFDAGDYKCARIRARAVLRAIPGDPTAILILEKTANN